MSVVSPSELMPFNVCLAELEYTTKLAKLAQTTRAAVTEEVRFVVMFLRSILVFVLVNTEPWHVTTVCYYCVSNCQRCVQ